MFRRERGLREWQRERETWVDTKGDRHLQKQEEWEQTNIRLLQCEIFGCHLQLPQHLLLTGKCTQICYW